MRTTARTAEVLAVEDARKHVAFGTSCWHLPAEHGGPCNTEHQQAPASKNNYS